MLQKTLGLCTDPFDPDDNRNLGGEPLRVDQEPKLMDLFCWKLAGLQQSKTAIDAFLFKLHNPNDKPAPKSGIVVIVGGIGTGKTTLASYVKRRVLEESATPATAWKVRDVDFPGANDPTRPIAFVEGVTELRNYLNAAVGKPPENIFLFLDNMPSGGFGAISNLYHEFSRHTQVYVVTTTDRALKQEELNWSVAARVKLISTLNVNAAELQAYMAERVNIYRDPKRAEFDNLSKMFPWAATAVQRLVGVNPDSDQPLRLLNRWLTEDVVQFHAKHTNDPTCDMGTLSQVELMTFMIP